jgi:hypothetical protein
MWLVRDSDSEPELESGLVWGNYTKRVCALEPARQRQLSLVFINEPCNERVVLQVKLLNTEKLNWSVFG